MKALAFIIVAIAAACGGSTANVDGGAGDAKAPPVPCWGDARTDALRKCTVASDCAVVDHVNDCCGSIVEEGVRVDQVDALHNDETEANSGCATCQCMANPTTDESDQSGGAYVASCDMGLCTAHAQ